MSRRGKEFNHRTAIFEGAFRAWSHLGGLSPEMLETRTARELDPTTFVIENDERLNENISNSNGKLSPIGSPPVNADVSPRRKFAYETLPRSGILHPFIRAVLSAWLGTTGVDKDALEIGLGTLRCWWQHRRKGENKTAIKTLGGTDAMLRDTLDRYTQHFFELAHCLVVVEQVEAPRTLKKKLSDRQKRAQGSSPTMGVSHSSASSISSSGPFLFPTVPLNINGKCVPKVLSFPEFAKKVNRSADMMNMSTPSIHKGCDNFDDHQEEFGGIVPMVYLSGNGELQILLHVDGITCAHGVLILETVLKGCSKDGKSPIVGLLDAVADRSLNCVVIRIDDALSAPRIAFQAQRNINLVGYRAHTQEIKPTTKTTMERWSDLCEMLVHTQRGSSVNFIDWSARCSCSESGLFRHACSRHEQITPMLAHLLTAREAVVEQRLQSGADKNWPEQQVQPLVRGEPISAEVDYLTLSSPRLRDDEAHFNPGGLPPASNFLYEDQLPAYQHEHNRQPVAYAPCHLENDEGIHYHAFGPTYAFDSMEESADDWEPEPLSYGAMHQV